MSNRLISAVVTGPFAAALSGVASGPAAAAMMAEAEMMKIRATGTHQRDI